MQSVLNKFEFRYRGESNSIDINTLLVSQFHYTAILNEIKSTISPDMKLNIRIQSFEKGSFNVTQVLEITATVGQVLFPNTELIKQMFEFLKGYIDLKKILGINKPKSVTESGDNNVIIDIDGNNNTVIVNKNIYHTYTTNPTMHHALLKNAEILDRDGEIQGIEIKDVELDKVILDIPREDFLLLTLANPYLEKDTEEVVKENVILYIRKMDFNPQKGTKWDFIYDGRKISSVPILDDEFLALVASGEKFGNGDRLNVSLVIKRQLDIDTGAFLDHKYEIIQVHNILKRDIPNQLFE